MTPEKIILIVFGALIVIPTVVSTILAFARVKLRVHIRNDAFSLSLHAIGLHFTLLEDGEETQKKYLIPCYNPENVLAREMKAAKKAAVKKARKKVKKQERKIRKKQEKAKRPKTNLQENIELLLTFLKLCYRKTNGNISISVRKFRILVSTGTMRRLPAGADQHAVCRDQLRKQIGLHRARFYVRPFHG